MPSSYTTSARFTLQATGENNNTWGVILNSGVFQLVDDNVNGRLAFALSGAKVLTSNLGATDEARMAFLDVTGGTGGVVTIPAVAKLYVVRNAATGPVTISTGGPNAAIIYPGETLQVACDGGAVRRVRPSNFDGATLTQVGTPTLPSDGANKNYVDFAVAGVVAGGLPVQSGHAGEALFTDGANAGWAPALPAQGGLGGKFLKTNGVNPAWSDVAKADVGLSAVDNVQQVAKAGDTMTGPLSITGPAGTDRGFSVKTGAALRWAWGAGSSAEAGANAGSDFFLNRYDDAGTWIDTPLIVNRKSGLYTGTRNRTQRVLTAADYIGPADRGNLIALTTWNLLIGTEAAGHGFRAGQTCELYTYVGTNLIQPLPGVLLVNASGNGDVSNPLAIRLPNGRNRVVLTYSGGDVWMVDIARAGNASAMFAGFCTPDATPGYSLPFGWNVVRTGVGQYTVGHSLNTTSYAVTANAMHGPGISREVYPGANSFGVVMCNGTTLALQDLWWNFHLMMF